MRVRNSDKVYLFRQQNGTKIPVRLFVTYYIDNNNVALEVYDLNHSPVARISVNVDKMPENWFAVDTNNVPTAEEFLKNNHIATYTGGSVQSGYCEYPVYAFTDSFLSDEKILL